MKKEPLIIKDQSFTGERALFSTHNAYIESCLFHDGESPLKESSDLKLNKVTFQWKYPLWYVNNAVVNDSRLLESARSGIWYTNHLYMENCLIEAPKTFRRASDITLVNCQMPNASETFWKCKDIKLKDVTAKGDYFGMNSENIEVDNLTLDGNYLFDGGKNIIIKNSILNSKEEISQSMNVRFLLFQPKYSPSILQLITVAFSTFQNESLLLRMEFLMMMFLPPSKR